MKKLNKKAFTLIELLAVIIILGILMIIAIPSVTEYINNSRKSAYVDTASAFISAARTKVNELKELKLTSENVLYFIEVGNAAEQSCVSLEKGGNSPYGKWKKAYVVVEYNGKGYSYSFTGVDEANYAVKLTKEKDLDRDLVKTNEGITDTNIVEKAVNLSAIGTYSTIDTSTGANYHLVKNSSNDTLAVIVLASGSCTFAG